jgi:DNA-binding NarL/FixJ family response regulator
MSDRLKLLIVEGHDLVRAAFMQRLDRVPGMEVLGAVADVPAALSLVWEQAPDLVLCDPQTIATEPRAAVSTLAATGFPVVVWTSSLVEGEAAVLRAAGAGAVLLKDLNISHLLWTIRSLCGADTDEHR